MKDNADRQSSAKERDIPIGYTVLIRQKRHNKLSLSFDPKPHRAIKVKRSTVPATRKGHFLKRSTSFYRCIRNKDNIALGDESTEDYLTEEIAVDRSERIEENRQQTTGYLQRDKKTNSEIW